MRIPIFTKQFDKEFKKIKKSGRNLDLLKPVINKILENKRLEEKYRDHSLKGKLKNSRECHVYPDCLLIYEIDKKNDKVYFYRIGSHSELFS